MDAVERARQMRRVVELLAQGAADEQAAQIPSLFPAWPEWRQPEGAHDAYPEGAKVTQRQTVGILGRRQRVGTGQRPVGRSLTVLSQATLAD